MKSLSVKVGFIHIIIGLVIFSDAVAWGADWRKFFESDIGEYFYDAQNTDRSSGNIVIVYEKNVLTQKGVWGWVQRLGDSFRNLSYTISLWELDCMDRRWHWLVMAFYSNQDKILKSVPAAASTEWNIINPESFAEPLYEAVCK
jgi:hypothetical protein